MTATDPLAGVDPQDLRDSVRDFRNPRSTPLEVQCVRDWWELVGIKNQFQAMLWAADIECERGQRECSEHHRHETREEQK